MRYAELQPDIPTSSFPTPLIQDAQSNSPVQSMKPSMNISRRRSSNGFRPASEVFHGENEFLDAEIDDEDLLAAGEIAISILHFGIFSDCAISERV